MNIEKNVSLSEEDLNALGTFTLELIKIQGPQMEEEIDNMMEKLEHQIVHGYSSNGVVNVTIDGSYQIIDISIAPTSSDWMNDQGKMCALIAEAVNDGIYKVSLSRETAVEMIQYKYTGAIIQAGSNMKNTNQLYRRNLSDMKRL